MAISYGWMPRFLGWKPSVQGSARPCDAPFRGGGTGTSTEYPSIYISLDRYAMPRTTTIPTPRTNRTVKLVLSGNSNNNTMINPTAPIVKRSTGS